MGDRGRPASSGNAAAWCAAGGARHEISPATGPGRVGQDGGKVFSQDQGASSCPLHQLQDQAGLGRMGESVQPEPRGIKLSVTRTDLPTPTSDTGKATSGRGPISRKDGTYGGEEAPFQATRMRKKRDSCNAAAWCAAGGARHEVSPATRLPP